MPHITQLCCLGSERAGEGARGGGGRRRMRGDGSRQGMGGVGEESGGRGGRRGGRGGRWGVGPCDGDVVSGVDVRPEVQHRGLQRQH
eukprot:2990392-Rhodomonas_salina.1